MTSAAQEFAINLIRGTQTIPPGAGKRFLVGLIIGVVLAILLVTGVWWFLNKRINWQLTQTVGSLQSSIKSLETQLATFNSTDVALESLGQQVQLAEQILKATPRWTFLLKQIEQSVLREVIIENLAADRLGTLRMSGSAATLAQVMDQLELWQKQPIFKKVSASGLTQDAGLGASGRYRFVVTLELTPQALYGR